MIETATAAYFFPPRIFTQFARLLDDIRRSIFPLAAQHGLVISNVKFVAPPDRPDESIGIEIEAHLSSEKASSETGALVPALETILAAVLDGARQYEVDRERTVEAQRRKISELAEHAEKTQLNGNSYMPTALTISAVDALQPAENVMPETGHLESYEIERGRFRINSAWVILDSAIAECVREICRSVQISPDENGRLSLEQTESALDVLIKALTRARKILNNPFDTDEA